MQTKRIWLFSAHLLPLVARLCLVPLETIVFINKFSMIFTGLEVIYFLASNLLVPYNLAKTAYRELAQVFIVGWCCKLFSFCDRISVLRYFPVDGIKGILYFGLFLSCRWLKCTGFLLWECHCGTSWSFQFSSCVFGSCCLLCRYTPTSAQETSLLPERGCFSFFLQGKTINQAARHFTFYVTDPLEGVFIYFLPCIIEGAGSVYKT